MEATKLKTKKNKINKGKLKKTIKNVICRPDPLSWTAVTEAEESLLTTVLNKHRVHIPIFKKPHWNELKLIPKNERPKPQPIEKIDGLLFGMSICKSAIENNDCSAVIIEALIEPKLIIQSITDTCVSSDVPVICLNNLKTLTKNNFGIQSSCIGVKKGNLSEISEIVKEIYEKHKPQSKELLQNNSKRINLENEQLEKEDSQKILDVSNESSTNPYLFRTNKKTRVFVPSNKPATEESNKFGGQSFIKLPTEQTETKADSKSYMGMILKKISNNPNRKRKANKMLE